MGTVGLSFGSPTSGQGFDVQSTVSAIVANLQAVETPWKNQLSSLQAQDTALSTIGSDLGKLLSDLQALTDPQGILSAKEGQSSDTSVLQLTGASTSAVAGSHTVVVNQLAQTAIFDSSAIKSGDTVQGSVTINGQEIDVDSSDNTLAGLAKTINNGNFGVTANVVSTSSGDVLSLVSNTSGAAGNISISSSLTDQSNSGSAINFTQAQKGQDASLTVDGLNITSASNVVTDAIPGVTFQLLNTSAQNTSVQVQVTNDNTDVGNAISQFVSDYNQVITDLDTQEGNDSSGNPEPLLGSPTVATIQEQLQQAFNFTQSGGGISSITQLGVGVDLNQDTGTSSQGTLTLDTDTLQAALNNNYQAIVNFFQPGNGFTSFGDNLTSVLNSLGNTGPNSGPSVSAAGTIFLQLQQDSTVEQGLNTNINNENSVISTEQTQLTDELNQANFTLQAIPVQLQSVNELYSAITGFNERPE